MQVPPNHGMVASSQRAATKVGVDILRAGGNAADTAIAVAAALAVTEPASTGIGGDCFALYYDAATREVTALNGSGRAPAQLSIDRVRADGLAELPPDHAHTITVPGACAGWFDLIARHGTLAMPAILAPAIALAEDGFAVGEICAHFWAEGLASRPGAANLDELSIGGRAPRAGEVFHNPGLARALRAIAEGGPDAFYRGAIGDAIVRVIAESGGAMTAADLGRTPRPGTSRSRPRTAARGSGSARPTARASPHCSRSTSSRASTSPLRIRWAPTACT